MLPTTADFQNEGILAAYQFINEWADKQWLNTQELTDETSLAFMLSRQGAALNLSSIFLMTLSLNDPDTDWRVAPQPVMTAGIERQNFAGGSAVVVPATSAHPDEAVQLNLWLTSAEGQRLKYGLGDRPLDVSEEALFDQALPANRTIAQELADGDPQWAKVLIDLPIQPPGIGPTYSQIYTVLADMQERIALTDSDVAQELATAQQQSQALLDEGMAKFPDLYAGAARAS